MVYKSYSCHHILQSFNIVASIVYNHDGGYFKRCGSRITPVAASVMLVVRMDRSIDARICATVLKRMSRSTHKGLNLRSRVNGNALPRSIE
ncbi:hypothetical protein TNCV_1324351 [Trichonephila clavipes]|nr:hypothetical protein TNCV_1324351 [Trichonephila clavipes]